MSTAKTGEAGEGVACRHTKQPAGYLAWHEWAERKSRTHEQARCPGCGLFAVWRHAAATGDRRDDSAARAAGGEAR